MFEIGANRGCLFFPVAIVATVADQAGTIGEAGRRFNSTTIGPVGHNCRIGRETACCAGRWGSRGSGRRSGNRFVSAARPAGDTLEIGSDCGDGGLVTINPVDVCPPARGAHSGLTSCGADGNASCEMYKGLFLLPSPFSCLFFGVNAVRSRLMTGKEEKGPFIFSTPTRYSP